MTSLVTGGAGALVTLLFGHGLGWGEGGVVVSWIALVYTAFLGFWLLWIRQRTGSVIMAIVAHNLINFISSFI